MKMTEFNTPTPNTQPSKRIGLYFEGTWQTKEGAEPTNITKLCDASNGLKAEDTRHVRDMGNHGQLLRHYNGIGTDKQGETLRDKFFGGAFGHGMNDIIKDAWLFLSLNYNPGDEIHMSGFSRGAYTARSLCGMINMVGLADFEKLSKIEGRSVADLKNDRDFLNKLADDAMKLYRDDPKFMKSLKDQGLVSSLVVKPDSPDAKNWRKKYAHSDVNGEVTSKIKMLACIDTVESLGLPDFIPGSSLWNSRYQFHDTRLSKIIEHAAHAVAIDENRMPFKPALMQVKDPNVTTLNQTWFAGGHGIGGGVSKSGNIPEDLDLANIAGYWVHEQMREQGWSFDQTQIETVFASRDPLAQPDNKFFKSLTVPFDKARAIPPGDNIHLESVFKRMAANENYRPAAIMHSPNALAQIAIEQHRHMFDTAHSTAYSNAHTDSQLGAKYEMTL